MPFSNTRQKERDRATFTDTVFGFFGVPAAKKHNDALAVSQRAIEQMQRSIKAVGDFKEALAELENTLTRPK